MDEVNEVRGNRANAAIGHIVEGEFGVLFPPQQKAKQLPCCKVNH